MTPQALKASVLQLAIQGKLVPQRPEEGTAEELYQQIQAEKQTLIANGTIKREKALEPIKADEIPFDIPETWKWVNLGEIVLVKGGKRIPAGRKLSETNTGHIYIRVSDMEAGSVNLDNLMYVPDDIFPQISQYIIRKEDVYITVAGTIGKIGRIPDNIDGANLTENADRLILFIINQTWLIYALQAEAIRKQIHEATKKVGQPKLAIKRIETLQIPLPPLEEQKRITAKIEEMLPLIDRYGEAYTELETFNKRFPDDLRKSILQEAIQGKLVPQLPEEGTAEELYQQIQAEKQRLIAAGTIKKEKPLPPIKEKDLPFDIPETWKWVRLGDCGAFTRGSGIKKNEVVDEGKPCVRYGQLYTTYKTRFSQAVSHVPQELFDKCKQASKGDILMALTGENKVDIAMAVLYEGEEALAIGGDMTKFSPVRIDPHYFVYTLNSPYGISCKTERSTGDIIVHTSNDKLSTIPIPLPPLAEQQRIVAKIEEMLHLNNQL